MAARRPRLLSPVAYARRNGLYKGLLGGDRRWLAIGGALFLLRGARRTLGRTEQVVTVEKMEPGQWMSLRTIPAPTRRERKAARRAKRRT
jgi:hypothetical protein